MTAFAPAQAQKIRPDYFGMHATDWQTSPAVTVGAANFTTTGTYWRSLEPSPGEFDLNRLAAQVDAAEDRRAQPMIVLGQTPRFYSAMPDATDYYAYAPGMKAWKRYVTTVASTFGARLDYQIWPEPNIIQNWKGTPRQMAKLTAVASKAIKRVAPKAKVISPAVAIRLRGQQRWMVNYFKQRVNRKRVHTYVDAIALDPFPERRGTPEDSFKLMQTAREKLDRIGVRKPFWNNEINYGVVGAGEETRIDYSVNKQQSYVIRTYALSAAARMQRTYWLGWFHSDTMAVRLADANGAALPPGESYEVVRSWLLKTNFQGCAKQPNDVWVCTAKKGRKEVRRIYWKPSGRATIKTPRSTKRVEDQEGGTNERNGARRIRVTYKPLMVASRN